MGKEEDQSRLKMECLGSWELFGWIQSMASVRLTGGERDSLLLAFKDAKLSLVEYNPDTHDLQTLSLHHFEDEEVRGGYIHNEWVPSVRVDPDNRCAAMLAYGRKIIILPFKRDMTSGLEGEDPITDLSLDSLALSGSSRVLPSYTLDLSTVIQNATVDNIIDIQFLYGYNQPTLLILYEPLKTYAGRIAVRKDTCRLDVVTLDTKERRAAFIWSREILPFDCVRAVPVPQPVGGTLVFAVNSLFYLNQGIPLYGVSLNATGDKDVTTNITLKPYEGVKLSLDCAVAEFLSSDQLVISLNSGELYVLSLLVDSLRSVKGFHLDKAAASVLTTSLCIPGPNFLFLGSRLGNSLLLRFSSREAGQVGHRRPEREPPSKKMRVDMSGDWLESELEMDAEFEVYGNQETAAHRISAFTFEVCDSLLNIGPCGQVAMGEPAFLSEEFASSSPDPDIELVTTAGHGKNGALCLLQKTVRPQVVTTFELPGCQDMWTVYGREDKQEHSFLIISRNQSSMILQTGQEINELDSSGFFTAGPTVFCGNLGSNQFIVQVTQDRVLLLKDSELIQTVPLDLGSPITSACCADPHLAVLAVDGGQAAVLTLTGDQLAVLKTRIGELPGRVKSPFLAISLYKDMSGLLTNQNRILGKEKKMGRQASLNKIQDLDEEDELLYGSSDAPPGFSGGLLDQSQEEEEPWMRHLDPVTPTYWLVAIRENGNFELYSIPDFSLRFVSLNFPHQVDVLVDNMSTRVSTSNTEQSHRLDRLSPITEVLMVGLGMQGKRPVLLARTKDCELMMYEVYPYYSRNLAQEQLKIRFRKMSHGLILRERRSKTKKETPTLPIHRSSLRHFSDIAGYEGVFLTGPYPHWIFLTSG